MGGAKKFRPFFLLWGKENYPHQPKYNKKVGG